MYVLNGKVVLYPDGTGVDKQESDDVLYVQDVQTGELFTIAPNRISELAEPTDPQAVIAEREEAIAAATNQEIAQEEGAEGGTAVAVPTEAPEVRIPAPRFSGARVTLDLPNGSSVNGVVLQETDDGVEVQTDSPVNGRFVQVFPTDEFDGMLSSVRDEADDVIWSREVAEGENAANGQQRETKNEKPTLSDVIATLYEKGKEYASSLFGMKFFDVAQTPQFMKDLGIRGSKFTIRYGVISRHWGKDNEHTLPREVWEQLPKAIQHPFAITKYYSDNEKKKQKGYRVYTSLQLSNGSFVVVSVEVKNAGRNIEVNAINTIFGRERISDVHDELIYTSETITPEQMALLNENNPHQYPSERESSESKDTSSSRSLQGNEGENAANGQQREMQGNGIPVDAKTGEPVYDAVAPDVAWDAIVQEAEGDEAMAMQVVTDIVADMEAKVQKAKKAKVRAGSSVRERLEAQKKHKRRIEEAEAQLEAWRRIAAVKAERIAAAERAKIEAAQQREVTQEDETEVPDFVFDKPENARENADKGLLPEDTVGGSPVALAYLLEGGVGSILNAGYFLHGVAAAYPKITNIIERIRATHKEVLGLPPLEFVQNHPDIVAEIEKEIYAAYGQKGTAIYRKLCNNASGFYPRQGVEIGREIEALENAAANDRQTEQPKEEQPKQGDSTQAAAKEDALKPIGKSIFGNIYDQFKGKVKEAFDFLLEHKSGDLLGVFHREDIGDIDLVWGDKGGGLAHIIDKHINRLNDFSNEDEMMRIIENVINNGAVNKRKSKKDKVVIELDNYFVVIRKNTRDKKGNIVDGNKNWIVTAFDNSKDESKKKKETSSDVTLATPNINQGSRAVASDGVPFTHKDTPQNSAVQTSGQENAETSLQSEVTRAEQQTNAEPTEGQKEAGNYKKGRVKVGPFDVVIEQPRGSVRSGVDANGKAWETTMQNTYGYFGGTKGVDGDAIDVFLGNDLDEWDGTTVFVVDQYNPDGSFDEHKVMLGFNSQEEAEAAYFANYEADWAKTHRTEVTAVPLADFTEWVKSSKRKTKAFAEYKVARRNAEIDAHNEQNEQLAEQLFSMAKEAETEKDFFDRAASLFEVTGYESDLRDIYNGVKSGEIANARALSFYTNATLKPVKVGVKAGVKVKAPKSEQKQKAEAPRQSGYERKHWHADSSLEEMLAREKYLQNAMSFGTKEMAEVFPMAEEWQRDREELMAKYGDDLKNALPNDVKKAFLKKHRNTFANQTALNDELYELRSAIISHKEKAASRAEAAAKEQKAEEANKRFGDFLNGKTPLRRASIVKALTRVSNFGKEGSMTMAQFIEKHVAEGTLELRTKEVDKLQGPSRRQLNRMDASQQAQAENRVKQAGKKTEYLINGFVANKTAYEYAEHLLATKKGKAGEKARKHAAQPGASAVSTQEAMLRDALVDVAQQSGLEVVVDEKAQQVLDEVNENGAQIRLQAKLSSLSKAAKVIHNWIARNAQGKVFTIELPESTRRMIRNVMGRDFDSHNITINGIRHGLKNHGVEGKKLNANSIPIREEDAELIPYIMTAPDYVRKGSEDVTGRESVRFYKTLSNGYVVVVEKEYKNSPNDMETINIWAEMSSEATNAQRRAVPDTNVQNAILSTDAAKIRKDAEDAIRKEEKLREHRVLTADNGEPSNLPEKQWHEVRTDEFKNWFGDWQDSDEASQVVDENGEPLIVYHGTDADFSIFDRGLLGKNTDENASDEAFARTAHVGFWFSTQQIPWVDKHMPVYLNFRNPLRFDSLEEMANAVGEAESVEAYLNELRSAGYDSIIVEADEEYGGASYVALEPNQIKSATENVGSFSSSEDDIRYFRTPGGEAYGFTVDGKIYLDPRIATAETPIHEYAHLWADMIRNVNAEAWNDIVGLMKATPIWEEVKGLYPELKTDDEIADEVLAHYSGRRGAERLREAQQQAAAETGKSVFERAAAVAAIERVKQALAKFWQSVAELFHIRFTSAEEVADRVLADMLNGVNPNQYIKRKGKGVQKLHLNDKTLAGIHNITEEKLRKALNLGGLANPSLAIIDTAQNKHEDFGEISLIAPSALVDKETGQTAGTWTTDAYTQRYPQVERVMSEAGYKKFDKWVESLDLTDIEKAEVRRQSKDSLENNSAPAWEMMYLREKGIDTNAYTSKAPYEWKQMLDTYGSVDELLEGTKLDEELQKKVINYVKAELSKPIKGKIREQLREQIKEETGTAPAILPPRYRKQVTEIFNRDYAKDLFGEDLMLGEEDVKKVMQQLFDLHNRTKHVDFSLSKSKASTYVHSHDLYSDYLRWQNKKLKEFGVKGRLFRGYSADGSRKYIPETLKNVSKAMVSDAKGQTNGGEMVSLGSFVAKFADRVDSADEMRANKKRLATNESKQGFYSEWMPTYKELADELSDDIFAGEQRLHDIAVQDNPVKYAKKEYGITLSKSFMDKLNAFKKAIREDMTSAYFETKFERPVYLNEFAAAVIPSDLSEDVKGGLEKSGIAIYEYDPKIEGDRDRATNAAFEADNRIRFQFVGQQGAAALDKAEEATTRLDNLGVAREMERQEKDAKAIKLATGWERGGDGKWRYEIMDGELKKEPNVKEKVSSDGEVHYETTLGEILDNEQLYRSYPELRTLPVSIQQMDVGVSGIYLPSGYMSLSMGLYRHRTKPGDVRREIEQIESTPEYKEYSKYFEGDMPDAYIGREDEWEEAMNEAEAKFFESELGKRYHDLMWGDKRKAYSYGFDEVGKGVILHEVQHAIQHIEGFAMGGNSTTYREHLAGFREKYEAWSVIDEFEDKSKELGDDARPIDVYNALVREYQSLGLEFGDGFAPSREAFDKGFNLWTRGYDNEGYEDAYNEYQRLMGKFGSGEYNNRYDQLAGEVEARNVQNRLHMPPEERRQSLAEETEDVAREDQIFIMENVGGGNASQYSSSSMVSPLEMSDAEKYERGERLRNAPAVDVESNQIVKTEHLSARNAAEKWWDEYVSSPLHYQTEIGEVVIDKNSIGSSLAHRYGQAKLDAITSLKDGFKNAVYLGSLQDFTRDGQVYNHYFAYPIQYNGERCYVFCRALHDANKNHLYVHEVFVASKIEKGNTLQTAASQPHGGIALYKDILANVLDAAKVVENSETSQGSAENNFREGKGELSDDMLSYLNDPMAQMMGKPRGTKKQRAQFAERERGRMQAHAEKLVERLHLTNVEIVTDASQLDGKQRTAKGFYNKRTGKITIVLPNHASTADVEQTLLHEAVAHYGLRQLFGEHFDDFLDMVYRNAEEGIRRKIAEASAKHGWNVRMATEEYLADLAERTDFEHASPQWWAKIKGFFLDMLRGLGFEAMDGQTLTDNELRYVLWRSYENLTEPGKYPTFIAEARDVAKQHALQVGRFAPTETAGSRVAENEALSEEETAEILFRDGNDYQYTQALARDRYERRIKSGMYQTQEALQDSMLGLRTAMESILEAEGRKGVYIEDIDGFENAYLGENRLSSVNQAEAEKFSREQFMVSSKKVCGCNIWVRQNVVASYVLVIGKR